jgi:hypothetical protein
MGLLYIETTADMIDGTEALDRVRFLSPGSGDGANKCDS